MQRWQSPGRSVCAEVGWQNLGSGCLCRGGMCVGSLGKAALQGEPPPRRLLGGRIAENGVLGHPWRMSWWKANGGFSFAGLAVLPGAALLRASAALALRLRCCVCGPLERGQRKGKGERGSGQEGEERIKQSSWTCPGLLFSQSLCPSSALRRVNVCRAALCSQRERLRSRG